ncbi:MAG: PAAR domain-containing protein [Shewanella sp.]|nr:PAAR domain-containing protein [Shewanella sp.]MCF1432112.1 PAAR domain-containing protein [Shewanella sp.]MCF1439952.1 PAAR domain-containing protein [Shewanella sp.]MCF1456602.1 PAAR domain-containing protein [Shewanella sp.]
MTLPAARLTDMHVCPMQTPAVPAVPHVGGPVIAPGAPTVLIGSLPAATVNDVCVCVGAPDSIAMGSTTVLLSNKPAARMGDITAHGGTIVTGMPTVLIGG